MPSRLVTPGLPTGSATISRPVSVTALRIFFSMTFGSSSSQMQPDPPMLLLICFSTCCRS
jgi:hypothetical protein